MIPFEITLDSLERVKKISKSMEGTELDFIEAILPHPTLSEMLHESVLQAYDKPIHI